MLLRADSGRIEIWGKSLDMALANPWIGGGFSIEGVGIEYKGTVLSHSHNVVLDTLLYSGIVGVMLLVAHWVLLFRDVFSKINESTVLILLSILAFSGFILMTNGAFLLDRINYYWIGYWLPVYFLLAYGNPRAGEDSHGY